MLQQSMASPSQDAGQFSLSKSCQYKQALSQRQDAAHPADINSMYTWYAVTGNVSVKTVNAVPKILGLGIFASHQYLFKRFPTCQIPIFNLPVKLLVSPLLTLCSRAKVMENLYMFPGKILYYETTLSLHVF